MTTLEMIGNIWLIFAAIIIVGAIRSTYRELHPDNPPHWRNKRCQGHLRKFTCMRETTQMVAKGLLK